jgi:hypothetical protein
MHYCIASYNGRLFPVVFKVYVGGTEDVTSVRVWRSRVIISVIIKKKQGRTQLAVDSIYITIIIIIITLHDLYAMYVQLYNLPETIYC